MPMTTAAIVRQEASNPAISESSQSTDHQDII
ncbi:hypothetical protein KR100_05085 [Synechococcus sp. KORDI-100]|nr:hypothetical protein KR100_05085 [Synechococcus sp. KORDI-100]